MQHGAALELVFVMRILRNWSLHGTVKEGKWPESWHSAKVSLKSLRGMELGKG